MAENWVQVEYDPDIVDAEVDEAIELLEILTFYNDLIDDNDDPEDIMAINQNVPVPSFLYSESSVDVLRNYCEGFKVPTEPQFLLEQFAQQIRVHRLSIPKISPTIDIFFGSKPLGISHIRLRGTRALFSITILRIYNIEKCEQVKDIIFNKFAMDLNTFLFEPSSRKYVISCMYVHTSSILVSMARKDQKQCVKPVFLISQFRK